MTSHEHPPVPVSAAVPEQLGSIVDCHIAAFPEEIPTLLGRRFLKGMYRYYMDHPEGFCLVVAEAVTGAIHGVVIGGKPGMRVSYVKRHVFWVACVLLCRLFTSSVVRRRFGRGVTAMLAGAGRALRLLPPGPERPAALKPPAVTWSILRSICVHPDARGKGVGRALVSAFEQECIRRGYARLRLTVAPKNVAALAVYRKLGWRAVGFQGGLCYFEKDGANIAGFSPTGRAETE